MAENPFEIPQQIRDMTEQNMKQAQAAYEQLADFMTKSMTAWMGAMPASPAVAGFKEVQERATDMAKKNADAAFALADQISKSRDMQEILSLQTRFAQDQMQTFASQTQELHKLIGDAVKSAQRG
jgi:hypothetical protein